MTDAEAVVALGGMFTGIVVTIAIVWGVLQGIKANANSRAKLPDPMVDRELAALRDQMDGMQAQLQEAQERIDFTERLLAQQRSPEQLPRS